MSTALDTELAVEYLMSKETVTYTRLSSLGALHRAVEAGSMPTGAVLASIVKAVLRNLGVGNIRVRREGLVIVGVIATRLGGAFAEHV